jgi:acetylornithine/succinyldiaminopimelate/putrescine aminotransferase
MNERGSCDCPSGAETRGRAAGKHSRIDNRIAVLAASVAATRPLIIVHGGARVDVSVRPAAGLQGRHADRIVDVRGAGLIAGLEFKDDVPPIVTAALERGLLVNRTATRVLRLLPPYIATERDVDEAVGILGETLR